MEMFWLDKPYAETYRLGPKDNVFMEKNGLRIQRESPSHVLLQWRIKSRAGKPGSGSVAQGSLSKAEVTAIRDYLTAILPELSDR